MILTINFPKLKTFFFLFPYFAMIVIGLISPSDGNHGIMTPKSLSFIGSVLFFLAFIFTQRSVKIYQFKLFGFAGAMMTFLLIWLFIGFMSDHGDFSSAIDQFKIFCITIAFVMMTLYAVSESLVKRETIIKVMIFSNFAYSLIKLTLILLHFFSIVNLFAFMEVLGLRFMSMDITAGLSRFQTSVDIVTPFFMLFVLQSDQLNLGFSKKFKSIYCFFSIISIFFSFSRFLMAVAACSGLFYCLTLNKKNLFKAVLIALFVILVFIYSIGIEHFTVMIERRFFSNDNYYSDLTRSQQIHALLGQFIEVPYLGMGLGGHVKNFVRDNAILHSYEVQWVAFLMQFGLIGTLLLLIPVGYICFQFFVFSRVHLSFLSLFLIWLLSGFTNPFLISLASGIIYSIFLLAADLLNKKAKDYKCRHE